VLLSRVTMRPSSMAPVAVSPSGLVDLIWLNIEQSDGIEHIHARAAGPVIEVVFFTVASEQSISDHIAIRICERATKKVPALRGWLSE